MEALVVGHAEPAAALTSALCEQGVDAHLHAIPRAPSSSGAEPLAGALVELEDRLTELRPLIAVGVGTGDAPLALALSAAKLGIPFVAWVEDGGADGSELDLGERRILATLAAFDAGPVGEGIQAFGAAERIAAWAREEPSDLNLD